MTKNFQVYKCEKCGNIVEVLHAGDGELTCCGQPMKLLAENTTVGAVAHPMEEKHYIEWIELQADSVSYRAHLKPGDKPEATFHVTASRVTAREYCNLHGLWMAQA